MIQNGHLILLELQAETTLSPTGYFSVVKCSGALFHKHFLCFSKIDLTSPSNGHLDQSYPS